MPNLATILVGAAVAALIGLVIYRMIVNKKKNPHGCGGGCAGCPRAGDCESTKKLP